MHSSHHIHFFGSLKPNLWQTFDLFRGTLVQFKASPSMVITGPNLPPYLPVASRVNPLQLSNFEHQALFLLATNSRPR
jgi:hypothetical protein